MLDLARLTRLLEDATDFVAGEPPVPSLCRRVERSATAVLAREQAAGRCRAFRVRCEVEADGSGAQGLVLEVAIQPPAANARALVLRVRPH